MFHDDDDDDNGGDDVAFEGPGETAPAKRHLDRFSRFCRAHGCAEWTDTQRPRYIARSE